MNRIIEIKVCGNHLVKNSNVAGTRGEANVQKLRLTFDDGWDYFEKEVIFWDAYGHNATTRMLTTDLVEDIENNKRIYLVPIPVEALARSGELTFVIVGKLDNKIQASIEGKLEVVNAPDILESVDPTPTELQQVQQEMEQVIDNLVNTEKATSKIINMKVSVEQLSPDNLPTVEKTITDDAVLLHFGIPSGEKGEKGDKGDPGLKGEKGNDGYTPQRGVDYWTDADQEAIQSYIDESVGEIEALLAEI